MDSLSCTTPPAQQEISEKKPAQKPGKLLRFPWKPPQFQLAWVEQSHLSKTANRVGRTLSYLVLQGGPKESATKTASVDKIRTATNQHQRKHERNLSKRSVEYALAELFDKGFVTRESANRRRSRREKAQGGRWLRLHCPSHDLGKVVSTERLAEQNCGNGPLLEKQAKTAETVHQTAETVPRTLRIDQDLNDQERERSFVASRSVGENKPGTLSNIAPKGEEESVRRQLWRQAEEHGYEPEPFHARYELEAIRNAMSGADPLDVADLQRALSRAIKNGAFDRMQAKGEWKASTIVKHAVRLATSYLADPNYLGDMGATRREPSMDERIDQAWSQAAMQAEPSYRQPYDPNPDQQCPACFEYYGNHQQGCSQSRKRSAGAR